MDETAERVRAIVAETLGRPADEIALDARFMEDLGADSLEVAEVVLGLENAFGVSVPDDAPEFIKTVGDAVAYIEARQGA